MNDVDVPCEVTPAGQVQMEVNGYKQLCQNLCSIVGELEGRLSGVLRGNEEKPNVKQEASILVEVAQEIRDQNDRLGGAVETLGTLLSRIEL